MINFALRNLKVFFKDKSAVFFSLLAVFIIIGLYALFLGDVWVGAFSDFSGARFLVDSWIVSGLLAITPFTTTMGVFGIMIEDNTKKIIKDFKSSPLKQNSIAGGYILSALVIGVIMSVVTLVLSEVYIIANGGNVMSLFSFIKTFGIILLSTLASTAIISFMVSFFNSQNAFAAASSIIGATIGFLTGIYLPVGQLPEAIQIVVKVFPVSHAAVLFRQTIMETPISQSFEGVPPEVLEEFNGLMGVTFNFGETTLTGLASIVILVITSIIFFGLSILKLLIKKK